MNCTPHPAGLLRRALALFLAASLLPTSGGANIGGVGAPPASGPEAQQDCSKEQEAYNESVDAYEEAEKALNDAVKEAAGTAEELGKAGAALEQAKSTLPAGDQRITDAQNRLDAAKKADSEAEATQRKAAEEFEKAKEIRRQAQAKWEKCEHGGKEEGGLTPQQETGAKAVGGGAGGQPEGANAVGGGTPGASTAGGTSAAPPMPKCKNSDADCAALWQDARFKQAAADSAERDLRNADTNLKDADAADQKAASLHDYGDQTYAVAAGYAKLGDKAQQEEYANRAREAHQQGNAETARAKQLRANAAAIKEKAETTAKEAEAAWKAYVACLSLPPCPPGTTNQSVGQFGVGENAPGAKSPGGGGANASGVFNPVEHAMGTGSPGDSGGTAAVAGVFQLMISTTPPGEEAMPPPPIQRAGATPGPAVPGQTGGGAGGTTPTGGGKGPTTPTGGGTGTGGTPTGGTPTGGTGTGPSTGGAGGAGKGAGTDGVKTVSATPMGGWKDNGDCDKICAEADQAEKELTDATKDYDAKFKAWEAANDAQQAANTSLFVLKQKGISPSPEQEADAKQKSQAEDEAKKARDEASKALPPKEQIARARIRAEGARARCELCRRKQIKTCATAAGGGLAQVSQPGGAKDPCDCEEDYKEWKDAEEKAQEARYKYGDARLTLQDAEERVQSMNEPGAQVGPGEFTKAVTAKNSAEAEAKKLSTESDKAGAAAAAAKAKYEACRRKHCPTEGVQTAGAGGVTTGTPGAGAGTGIGTGAGTGTGGTPTGGTPTGGTGTGTGTGAAGSAGSGTGMGSVKTVSTTPMGGWKDNGDCDKICAEADQAEKELADAKRAVEELRKAAEAKQAGADYYLDYAKQAVGPAEAHADAARVKCELCRRKQLKACATTGGGAVTNVSLPGGGKARCRDCGKEYEDWLDAEEKALEAQSNAAAAWKKWQELKAKEEAAQEAYDKAEQAYGASPTETAKAARQVAHNVLGHRAAARANAGEESDNAEKAEIDARKAASAAKAKYDACMGKHCPTEGAQTAGVGGAQIEGGGAGVAAGGNGPGSKGGGPSGAGTGAGQDAQTGQTVAPQNPCPRDCDEAKLLAELNAAQQATNAAGQALAQAEMNVTSADATMAAAGAALEGADPSSPVYAALQTQADAAKQVDAAAVAIQQAAFSALKTALENQTKAQQALDECKAKKAGTNCPPAGAGAVGGVPSPDTGGAAKSNGAGTAMSGGNTQPPFDPYKKVQDFYRGKASKLEGSQTVNGLVYQKDTIALMIATRDAYVLQLQIYNKQMAALLGGPQAAIDAQIQNLLPLSISYSVAKFAYQNSGTGGQSEEIAARELQRQLTKLEAAGYTADAAWLKKIIEMNPRDRMRAAFQRQKEILAQNPTLSFPTADTYSTLATALALAASTVNGSNAPYIQQPTDGAQDRLRKVFTDSIQLSMQQALDEINRVYVFKTPEEFTEFFHPQYARARQLAASLYGTSNEQQIFEDFARIYQDYTASREEVKRLGLALAAGAALAVVAVVALPVAVAGGSAALETSGAVATAQVVSSALNTGVMITTLAYDGSKWMDASSELANAEKGAPVLGQESVRQLRDQAAWAGVTVGLDVLFLGLSEKDLARSIGNVGTVRAAAAAKAAKAAAAAEAAAEARQLSTLQEAELGAAKAKQLGVDPATVDDMLGVAKAGPKGPYGPIPKERLAERLVAEESALAAKQLAAIGEIDNLVTKAKIAGVPQSYIDAILKPAAPGEIATWAKLVPNQLKLVTAIKQGKVLVIDNTTVAREALSSMVGPVPTEVSNFIRNNVIYFDALKLVKVAQKLAFMQAGKLVQWSPEEFALLQRTLARPDAAKLYTYIGGSSGFAEPIFYRLLTEEMVAAGNKLVTASNLSDIQAGRAILPTIVNPELLQFVPPTSLVNPQTGDLITAEQAGGLTSTEIRQLSPEFVQNGIADPNLKAALQTQMKQEAETILRSTNPSPAETSWAEGVFRGSPAAGITPWTIVVSRSPQLQAFEQYALTGKGLTLDQVRDLVMDLKADPAAMRSLKNASEEVRSAFNTAEAAIYKAPNEAAISHVKGLQQLENGAPAPWVGRDLRIEEFRTPRPDKTVDPLSINTDRDFRMLYKSDKGKWLEVDPKYWENVWTESFAEASGYTPDKLRQMASPTDLKAWKTWNPAEHNGQTLDQAMKEKWQELHQQLATYKYHPEAGADLADQARIEGELRQVGNNINSVKEGMTVLKDAEQLGMVWNEKVDAYLRLKSAANPDGFKLEAMAQLNKGTKLLDEVRSGYQKLFTANGQVAPIGNLPPRFQKAADAIKSLAPFDKTITPQQIAQVEGQVKELGFGKVTNPGNPLKDFKEALDGQFQSLKTVPPPATPPPAPPMLPAPPATPKPLGASRMMMPRDPDSRAPLEYAGQPRPRPANWTYSAGGSLQPVVFRTADTFPELAPGTIVRLVATDTRAETNSGDISFSFVSNGNSSGEGFELQVLDPTGKVKRIAMPEGVVLQPLKPGSAKPVAVRTVGNVLTKKLTAYCLDFAKLPPEAGQLYRIADQALQDKFKPMRAVLAAGRQLAAAGQFHPDSDANAYNDSIRQYSLWTKLENWGQEKFGEVFLEKTKQNAVSAKVKWTKQMEQAVRGLVPGRWRDISMVLDEAAKLSSASQTARPPQ